MAILDRKVQRAAQAATDERRAKQTTLKIANGGDERRKHIAQAVLGVVAREGVNGVTVRTVAQKTAWSAGIVARDCRPTIARK